MDHRSPFDGDKSPLDPVAAQLEPALTVKTLPPLQPLKTASDEEKPVVAPQAASVVKTLSAAFSTPNRKGTSVGNPGASSANPSPSVSAPTPPPGLLAPQQAQESKAPSLAPSVLQGAVAGAKAGLQAAPVDSLARSALQGTTAGAAAGATERVWGRKPIPKNFGKFVFADEDTAQRLAAYHRRLRNQKIADLASGKIKKRDLGSIWPEDLKSALRLINYGKAILKQGGIRDLAEDIVLNHYHEPEFIKKMQERFELPIEALKEVIDEIGEGHIAAVFDPPPPDLSAAFSAPNRKGTSAENAGAPAKHIFGAKKPEPGEIEAALRGLPWPPPKAEAEPLSDDPQRVQLADGSGSSAASDSQGGATTAPLNPDRAQEISERQDGSFAFTKAANRQALLRTIAQDEVGAEDQERLVQQIQSLWADDPKKALALQRDLSLHLSGKNPNRRHAVESVTAVDDARKRLTEAYQDQLEEASNQSAAADRSREKLFQGYQGWQPMKAGGGDRLDGLRQDPKSGIVVLWDEKTGRPLAARTARPLGSKPTLPTATGKM